MATPVLKRCSALVLAVCAAATLDAQPSERSFRFRDEGSRSFSVPLTETDGVLGITWPEAAGVGWDTALVGVDVAVAPDVTTPYVEIASGAVSDRQHFRPGDAGARWLNVSSLRGTLTPGALVRVRGEGVTFATRQGTLRLFRNGIDLSRRILVLAPHPDDAEIATFGVYAHRNATIVTVTAGNAGGPNYGSTFDNMPDLYHFKGRIRLIDSITVPWLGGIPPERTFNLGYFDARLEEMHDNPGKTIPEFYSANTDIGAYLKYNLGSLLPKRSRASTWPNLVDDLERLLKEVKPSVILAPHPQLDVHRDHQFTTVALVQALARWRRDVTLLLYTNHADQNRYPYGPAGTLVSLPPPPPGDVLLDRVYSHPVPADVQRLKLFALESMHDVRVSPSRLYQLVAGNDRAAVEERQDSGGDVSYLRRGPRSNELFFVYGRTSAASMIERFLADRARPNP